MSRSARVCRPGTLQHVVSRFLDRSWQLVTNVEREHYLALFGRAMAYTDWKCVAYCIMSHKVELAMIAGEQPLDSWAKRVNPPFAHWLNKQRRRLGPIFAHRPVSLEIEGGDERAALAWVHNNPVRSRLVSKAADVSWSSHRAYLGRCTPPHWLHVQRGIELADLVGRESEFDGMVALSTRKPSYVKMVTRHEDPINEVALARASCDDILNVVTAAFGLPRDALRLRYLRGPQSDAKRVAIHIARERGLPLAAMANALRISRQRASLVASTPLSPEQRERARELASALDMFADDLGSKRVG